MVNKDANSKKLEVIVQIASLRDSPGIHNALKQNLIEILDFDEIPDEQRKELEDQGFLRKEVDEDFYTQLIQDVNKKVYVAKNKRGDVIGFASIYNNENNIKTIRKTLQNLHIKDKEILGMFKSQGLRVKIGAPLRVENRLSRPKYRDERYELAEDIIRIIDSLKPQPDIGKE
ncbi:unnamed protein product [marine sediment metagenome]|uniref:N-acetyltransferase domain-containing protein n=1 Tax=marine sediment metagenome TaxID=412755 RepID=X1EUI1_9ZZZZ